MPLSSTALGWVSLAALIVAAVAVVVAAMAVRRVSAAHGRPRRSRPTRSAARGSSAPGSSARGSSAPGSSGPDVGSVDELSALVADLRDDVASALRHLAVVRYDAFGDMGGHLSWSLALLDDNGDGVLLTSIHGRSDARTYAKNVSDWTSTQQLSPEEQEAIGFAKGR